MNIEKNITRRTNLDANDSLSAFKNHTAQQSHFAYEVFYKFLSEIKPDRILEIGTALGGFTQFLKICVDDIGINTKILSYDITDRPWYTDMIIAGIDVRVENVFTEGFLDCNQEVINFIQQQGTTIILCDGGYKIGEFNLLSTKMKLGDYILAHDYAKDRKIFESEIKNKIWNWFEIQESDIEISCINNGLTDHERSAFNGAAWICKKKTS